MEWTESRMTFAFCDSYAVQKFDETLFYKKLFNALPNGKGVDFLSCNDAIFALIEVKNCRGDEANNRWRVWPDNKKKLSAHTPYHVENRDSLDIEVAEKLAMTIAALMGAGSFQKSSLTEELIAYYHALVSGRFADGKKSLLLILFLEGDFSSKSRSEKMILRELQVSLRKKLRWLNCKVSVVNSNTYPRKIFDSVKVN